jgi:hypothetical protein
MTLFFGTLALRLPLIGGPPILDDGTYAFCAEMTTRHAGAIPLAPLSVYPSLLAQLGRDPAAPLWRFRAADAFAAAGASVTLLLFLARWADPTSAFVMAVGWAIARNVYFECYGFSNPIPAATAVYVGALALLSSPWRSAPFWAGLLIPLAIALREPFLAIPVVSLYLAFAVHGRFGLLMHVAGLAVASAGLLIWVTLFRGPIGTILGYYYDIALLYRGLPSVGWDLSAWRWGSLRSTIRATRWLFPTGFLGVAWLLSPRRHDRPAKGLAILLFCPPLPEIFGKLCVGYHWAQLLLGVVFLGARGLSWLHSVLGRLEKPFVAILCYSLLAWLVGELDARSVYLRWSKSFGRGCEFAPVMLWGKWDDPAVGKSLFLEVGKYIKDNTRPGDSMMVTGHCDIFCVLSDRWPPSTLGTNLMQMILADYPTRRPDLVEALRGHPPRVVLEGLAWPLPPGKLEALWPEFHQRYRLLRTFPGNPTQYLGEFPLRIWILNEAAPAPTERGG